MSEDDATKPRSGETEGERPRRLGDFRLGAELGRGAMGVVVEAWQESVHRRVALKLLGTGPAATAEDLSRFEREAWIGGRLSHPNIVTVHAQGCDDGHRWIAMQLVEGGSLADDIERRAGELEALDRSAAVAHARRVVAMFVPVAEALQHVHDQGVIHRDIKPRNLLLRASDSTLLLTDFGVARDLTATGLTHAGDFLGTVAYMSPEQLAAQRAPVDRRSDIWSLGVSLYEALTLQRPHDGDTEGAYIAAILGREPVPARSRCRTVPRDLETILMKCLDRDADRRYASAHELAEDLRRFLDHEPVRARRPGPFLRTTRFVQRHGRAVAAVGLVALLAVAWSAVESHRFGRVQERRELAQELEALLALPISAEGSASRWEQLRPRLDGLLREDPDGELAPLARRASARLEVELPPNGLVRGLPPLLLHYGTEFLLGPGSGFLADLEGSWDEGPWRPIGSVALWSGAGTTVHRPIPLHALVPEPERRLGPHALAVRARIAWAELGEDGPAPPRVDFAAGPPEASFSALRALAVSADDFRSLGTHEITLLESFPDEFPRAVAREASDPSLAELLGIERLRLIVVDLPPGEGNGLGFDWPMASGSRAESWCAEGLRTWVGERQLLAGVDFIGRMELPASLPLAGRWMLRADGAAAEPLVAFPFSATTRGLVGPLGFYQHSLPSGARCLSIPFRLGDHSLVEAAARLPEELHAGRLVFEPSREVAREMREVSRFLEERVSLAVPVEIVRLTGRWTESERCR